MPIFRAVVRTAGRGATAAAQLRFEERLLRGMWRATDRGAEEGKGLIRTDMSGAGLGRLGGAIGSGSDKRRQRVHRRSNGFSVSGWIYVRGRSERTLGALKIYTEGGSISPVRSNWLWIATREIPRVTKRRRMTPALYNAEGFDSRIGPLVFIKGRHAGEALLIVRNVTTDRFGRGKARRLPKRGGIGAARERKDFIVAFVGIRRTSRAQRINPKRIIAATAARMPNILAQELKGVS